MPHIIWEVFFTIKKNTNGSWKKLNKVCKLNNIVLKFIYFDHHIAVIYGRECSCFKEIGSEEGKGIVSAIDPPMVQKII